MTGLRQRAGAAMFQARRETCSGEASRKPRISPPLEKCPPCPQYDDADPRVGVERLEHGTQLLTLGHRDDIERRAVEDHIGALPRGIATSALTGQSPKK